VIALGWDNDVGRCTVLRDATGAVVRDDGLSTCVLLSLFCDARARPTDRLPDDALRAQRGGRADRRGWCGEALGEPGDAFGSRLWLLERETRSAATLRRAETYAGEALAWLVTDRLATEVTVTATPTGDAGMWLAIDIIEPSGRILSLGVTV
jgi:phage gp46-like protein